MPDAACVAARPRSAASAMITAVKLSDAGSTVADLRTLFADDHVHSAVIVDGGVLLSVVDRADVHDALPDDTAARTLGDHAGRTVPPDLDLRVALERLQRSGRRRLAVVGTDGTFLGLLCLKRSRQGFCSDRDVRARALERRLGPMPAR